MSPPEILPQVKAAYWFPDGATPGTGDSALKIDSNLFTHLFCAFGDINAATHEVFVSHAHQSIFSSFTKDVQKQNNQVKTLLSIGGRTANHRALVSMASNSTTRKAFIDSSILIARNMKFEGLDLAWEYPNSSTEMANFGKLLEEWHLAIDDEHDSSDNACLLLTASVYYSPNYKSLTYPVNIMKRSLNWVNIIAYDFNTLETAQITNPTAALYDPSGELGPNGDIGLTKWIAAGLPKTQAVFGLSYVGWAFTLIDEDKHDYKSPTTGQAKHMNYDQIKHFIDNNNADQVYKTDVVEDYCYAGTTWIAFQGNQTIITKVKYAKDKKLLGYFAWNVTADVGSDLSTAASKAWEA